MAVTTNLGLNLLDQNQAQPHVPINDNAIIFEDVATGIFTRDITSQPATYTLSSSQGRMSTLKFTGTGVAQTITVPAYPLIRIVRNDCGQTVTLKTATGNSVAILTGTTRLVWTDGFNSAGN